MKKIIGQMGLTLALCLNLFAAQAAPLDKDAIPLPLKDWAAWVLQGHEALFCPSSYNQASEKFCVWPAQLELQAQTQKATFKLDVYVFGGPMRVILPGDPGTWPQQVSSQSKPLAVAEQDERPTVYLAPGHHQIQGIIPWTTIPRDLRLPPHIASLRLSINGQSVQRTPDEQNRIWLSATDNQAAQTPSENDVTIHTARLIDDQIPLVVTTHYDLAVSGQPREIPLPAALLPGFVIENIDSPLPVRLQDSGQLSLRVRPGNWTIEVRAHLLKPVEALSLPSQTASSEEIWAFKAHHDLRLVSIENVASVDPKQSTMPADWQALPAYIMRPGAVMKLTPTPQEHAPAHAHDLTIQRELWLDFDGQGYTAHDEISGTLTRPTRLDLAPPGQLGRVALNAADQPINRLSAGSPAGLELQAGALKLSADSRLPALGTTLSATGWLADFTHASAVLNLPPGWTLLHAQGVDQAQGSWVSQWSLWDFFFILLSAFAAAKLFGWRIGLLVGVTLTLTWHMPQAPRTLWLLLLALYALMSVLPANKWQARVRLQYLLCSGIILLMLLLFAIMQVRLSLYPALEQSEAMIAMPTETEAVASQVEAAIAPEPAGITAAPTPATPSLEKSPVVGSEASMRRKSSPDNYAAHYGLQDLDARTHVQTGPGLPRWQWHTHNLNWQGPVQAQQTLKLFLLSPTGTVLWRLISMLLLLATWWVLGRRAKHVKPPPAAPSLVGASATTTLVAVVLFSSLMLPLASWAANPQPSPAVPIPYPASSVLDELRQRLTAEPDCMPECISVPHMFIQANDQQLQLRLEVHTQAQLALPLPGQGKNWQPQQLTVNGQPAALRRDAKGVLWVALNPGVSQIILSGDIQGVSAVDISLPLAIRSIQTELKGWSLTGWDGQAPKNGAISLTRNDAQEALADYHTERDTLPPFIQITRTIELGLRWVIHTEIRRLAPSLAPVRAKIKLLPGEAVNDEQVQVEQGMATIQLGSNETATFTSTLKETSDFSLTSLADPQQIEVWQLNVLRQWHVQTTGLEPIWNQTEQSAALTWHPWPGEKVNLHISKPQGISGQTLTVDQVHTVVSPGARATDLTLTALIRSSQGGNHTVQLPPQAELLGVWVDQALLPLHLAPKQQLVIPITPGKHNLKITWREPQGMSWRFQNQAVNLHTEGVNDLLHFQVPQDRLVLAVGGPRIGPAVLFWGVLIVICLAGWVLGRYPALGLPLTSSAWILLGIGLIQSSIPDLLIVLGWFGLLEARGRIAAPLSRRKKILLQTGIILWTLLTIGVLLNILQKGLLGYPDLMIQGNGSTPNDLYWYADRFHDWTNQAWTISIPIYLYRIAMLLWALWLATALLNWIKWAWTRFSAGGIWPPEPAKKS